MQYSTAFILEIAGILFVIVFGTLLHFAFEYSGKNRVAGIFSPVNESTWEHLKLLFFPMALYTIIEYFAFGKYVDDFIGAKSIGILAGMIAIVALFYTYTGILGRNCLWADILTFIIGVLAAYWVSWKIIEDECALPDVWAALPLILAVCFIVFTFCPPRIALFLDPVTKSYGIPSGKKSRIS